MPASCSMRSLVVLVACAMAVMAFSPVRHEPTQNHLLHLTHIPPRHSGAASCGQRLGARAAACHATAAGRRAVHMAAWPTPPARANWMHATTVCLGRTSCSAVRLTLLPRPRSSSCLVACGRLGLGTGWARHLRHIVSGGTGHPWPSPIVIHGIARRALRPERTRTSRSARGRGAPHGPLPWPWSLSNRANLVGHAGLRVAGGRRCHHRAPRRPDLRDLVSRGEVLQVLAGACSARKKGGKFVPRKASTVRLSSRWATKSGTQP